MGRQVLLAQDHTDVEATAAWLRGRGDFRTLPAVGVGGTPSVPPSSAGARRQIVFYAEYENVIREVAEGGNPKASRTVFARPDAYGFYFEWNRGHPIEEPSGVYVATGGGAGRMYIVDPRPPMPASERLKKDVRALFDWVKRTSPWVGDAGRSLYIGASLGKRVLAGELQLQYPNGDSIGILPNKAYKAG